MSLAIRPDNRAMPAVQYEAEAQAPAWSFEEMHDAANMLARSGLFSIKTPEQAFALMLLCQAEGIHPINAVRRFHIIQGRPAMRSDAMQAEFQKRGGLIKVVRRDAKEARAIFSHPIHQPDGIELGVTFEQYKAAGLTGKDNWRNYPDDMLWARLATKGVRTVMPGVIAGIYSTEEMEDLATAETPAARHVSVHAEASRAIAAADATVPGWDASTPDTRPYHQVVTDAVNEVNQRVIDAWGDIPGKPADLDSRKIHGLLGVKAVNLGYADGPAPTKVQQAINFATKIYEVERQWVRAELSLLCKDYIEVSALALEAAKVKPEDISQEPREPGSDDADPDIDLPGDF